MTTIKQQSETFLREMQEGVQLSESYEEIENSLQSTLANDNVEPPVPIRQEREIAYWRRQYEENYDAAFCARLDAFAVTSRHDFITKRMENMSRATMELTKLVGNQETAELLSGVEPKEKTNAQ